MAGGRRLVALAGGVGEIVEGAGALGAVKIGVAHCILRLRVRFADSDRSIIGGGDAVRLAMGDFADDAAAVAEQPIGVSSELAAQLGLDRVDLVFEAAAAGALFDQVVDQFGDAIVGGEIDLGSVVGRIENFDQRLVALRVEWRHHAGVEPIAPEGGDVLEDARLGLGVARHVEQPKIPIVFAIDNHREHAPRTIAQDFFGQRLQLVGERRPRLALGDRRGRIGEPFGAEDAAADHLGLHDAEAVAIRRDGEAVRGRADAQSGIAQVHFRAPHIPFWPLVGERFEHSGFAPTPALERPGVDQRRP